MAELESASKETKAAGYMSHKEFCGKLNSSISKRGLTNTLSSVAVRVAGAPSLTWQTLVSVAAARNQKSHIHTKPSNSLIERFRAALSLIPA